MPEEWPLVALADVTEQRRTSVRVEAGRAYPLLGVRWYGEGPFLREVVTSESSKATKLFEVHADDFIYNRLFAYKGSFGRVPRDLAGSFVSNEFPLFTCRAGVLDPRFLELYFQQPSVWSLVEQESVGTTASRSRWKEEAFARHRIALPPLEVQRRIVDLMGAIDAHIGNLTTEARAIDDLLTAVAMSAFDGREGALASYEDVCELIVGGAWGDPPGAAETDVLALGPNAYSHGRLEVAAELGTLRSLTASRAAKRLLREGDVLLERSGGSPDQPVGRVVFAGLGSAGCVPSDFQRLLRPSPGQVLPRYFFWRLWADWRSGVSLAYSRRTTGITNLDVPAYLRRVVSWGSFEHQVATAGALDSIFAGRRILEEEVASLRRVRAQIAQSLLARGVEISESYGNQPAGVA